MSKHLQRGTFINDTEFLSIEGLTKIYDQSVRSVDDVHLQVAKGEVFALLGSSGCGKSTLLRMLAGFEPPTSGRVMLAGREISRLPPYKRPINMMFQSYALFPHLSVWENIAFGLQREGLPKREVTARVEHELQLVQLSQYARRKPYELSGGQQQRVALARSLIKRPAVLLLDEPLGALDKKLREQTQLELLNIIQQVEVTCVLVTHDQDEAMAIASRVAVMSNGRIIQVGTPRDIYESPNCRFVADFIGSVNFFKGSIDYVGADHTLIQTNSCLIKVERRIENMCGAATSVALRPEKISISLHADGSTHNTVEGKVETLAYYGSFTTFSVRLRDGTIVKTSRLNNCRRDDQTFRPGDQVYLNWSEDAIVILQQ